MARNIDNRIRTLIENGIKFGHRSMFFLIGHKAQEKIITLHQMLTKSSKADWNNILWCTKTKFNVNSHSKNFKKRFKESFNNDNENHSFELFIKSKNIHFCHYTETEKILGNTYGMCVLQDFNALTPNTLARTIETVKGGGLIIFLHPSVNSLNELYNLSMDVHEHYRTENHQEIIGRFNERFILSLSDCKRCLVLDDNLNALPLTSQNLQIESIKISEVESDNELKSIKDALKDTEPAGSLVECCKTTDQAKALLKFIEAISERNLRSTVSLTAARGRGKSATLGLAIASAVAFGYSNIFVSSPSPENLSTLFEFIFKGFDALEYKENDEYDIIQSTNPEFNNAIVRVNIFKSHRQTIQYIHPNDSKKLGQAELVVIDEAAAIPLPIVRSFLGPYLVFLASTNSGYEGTGRTLSLKLLQQLRQQAAPIGSQVLGESTGVATGRAFHELELYEPIRYRSKDDVERWLTSLLCLNSSSIMPIMSGCPPPDRCELYYINRETLFSYHQASEEFLQRLVALYGSSQYKNSPNDLQMMCDAPAHHLFCLLGPVKSDSKSLPEILVVIQVSLEGQISSKSTKSDSGKKPSGDLLPWAVAQHYHDLEFLKLSGARIVRIATHPDYQSMGYGRYALELLHKYYRHDIKSLDEENESKENSNINKELPKTNKESLLEENVGPRDSLPPLLLKLSERPPENLDYIGVSYGLTDSLLRFWKRAEFIPVYLSQKQNDLTGEHPCMMLSSISPKPNWLRDYFHKFRIRIIYSLRSFPNLHPTLGLNLLTSNEFNVETKDLSRARMKKWFTTHDINRLEMYSNNLADFHLIDDLVPTLAEFYFKGLFGDTKYSEVQSAIVLGIGLQRKSIETLANELDLTPSQLIGLFNRSIRRCTQFLSAIWERAIENDLNLKKPLKKRCFEEEFKENKKAKII